MTTRYNYNTEVFTREDATSYYLLGAFITDGFITNNDQIAGISSKDCDWIKLINDLVCPDKPIEKAGKNCFGVRYGHQAIIQWLMSNECIARKSLVVEFPNVPSDYMTDFIRGCW